MTILVGSLVFVIGFLVGCVAPSFVQLWRISQASYGAGYRAAKFVVGAHLRRALAALECAHFPVQPAGPVCRACATRARVALEGAVRVTGDTGG